MKATIRIDENELRQIIRSRMLNFPGVTTVTEIKPVLTWIKEDEGSRFDGMDVSVELGEQPPSSYQRD